LAPSGDDYSGSHSVLILDTEDLGAPNSRKFSDDREWSKDVPKFMATKFRWRIPLRSKGLFYGDFASFAGSKSG
jgi:hypothetical protein